MNVLLVDDQRFIALALEKLLASEPDVQLHFCDNAADAVARATALAPAVILQDLVMPGADGETVVRQLRDNPATARTPIVVLSGNEDEASRAHALASGANDYLVKLPTRDELIRCLRRHVRAAEPMDPAVAHAPEPDAGSETTLDRQVIADLGGCEGAAAPFLRGLIAEFTREAEAQIAAIRQAADSGNVEVMKRTAHSLKGSSMTLGARRLGWLCRQLEHADGAGAERCRLLAHAIGSEFSRVRKALDAL